MSMETASVATWTFLAEVPIPQDVLGVLVEGEQPYAAFKTMRDSAVFTSKRLIVRDAQGLNGRKVRVLLTALQRHQHVVDRKCGNVRHELRSRVVDTGGSHQDQAWVSGRRPQDR